MNRSHIQKYVYDIIAEKLYVDPKDINDNVSLEDLGADSLDMVEMIMTMEEVFGVSIEGADTYDMKTIGDIIDYIQNLNPSHQDYVKFRVRSKMIERSSNSKKRTKLKRLK